MVDAWMPGAERLSAETDGGKMHGGAPRVVWLTTECDPWAISARSAAQDLARRGWVSHLVWNPVTGEIVQLIPATRAGVGFVHGHNGRTCIQIRVLGFARHPFTDGPAYGLAAIVAWLDQWGVERRWCGGPPGKQRSEQAASWRDWSCGGHFGASQVPDSPEAGPGAIDCETLIGLPRTTTRRQAGATAAPSTTFAAMPTVNGPSPQLVTQNSG